MTILFFLYVLGGIAFVLAFFTATFGYLRAKIAATEREVHAEDDPLGPS